MEYAIHTAHWGSEHVQVAQVAAEDLHTALFEPGCVLCREGQHTHTVAAFLQLQDEVATQKAISSGDQYLHVDFSFSCTMGLPHGVLPVPGNTLTNALSQADLGHEA